MPFFVHFVPKSVQKCDRTSHARKRAARTHAHGTNISGWTSHAHAHDYISFRYVAEALFQVLYYMKQIMPRKIFVHCIGHSLGAQICGFTGKLIRKKLRKEKEGGHTQTFDSVLDRISGLDPAGPMFFNDNPEYKYPDKIEPGGRLAHTDAQVVRIL